MRAADCPGHINTQRAGHAPPNNNIGVTTHHDFSRYRWIVTEKDNHRDNTVAEQDQDHCSEELCYELLTFSEFHLVNCFLGALNFEAIKEVAELMRQHEAACDCRKEARS